MIGRDDGAQSRHTRTEKCSIVNSPAGPAQLRLTRALLFALLISPLRAPPYESRDAEPCLMNAGNGGFWVREGDQSDRAVGSSARRKKSGVLGESQTVNYR
jgi:hypothetical protein